MAGSAYGAGKANDTEFRRKWDKQEYAERARAREARDRHMEKNEERKRQGLPPLKQKIELEQPKELLKMREGRIDLESNLNKVQVVQGGASGEASRQPGFYCKACDIVVKDSVNYLDHINGIKHQRNLGVTMKVERASVDSVKERLALLKRKKEQPEESSYDLDARLVELKRQEEDERRRRKERKRQKKEKKMKQNEEQEPATEDADDMAKLMGFSGFGTSKV